jgi:hypothetical protein
MPVLLGAVRNRCYHEINRRFDEICSIQFSTSTGPPHRVAGHRRCDGTAVADRDAAFLCFRNGVITTEMMLFMQLTA